MVLPVSFFDRKIIDACEPDTHQATFIELPVLVPVRTEPIPRIVMPLVCESHCDAVAAKCPEFLDQPIIEFLGPFAFQKRDNFLPSIHELCAISPSRIQRICQSNFFGLATVPPVFGKSHFQLCGHYIKRWKWRTRFTF